MKNLTARERWFTFGTAVLVAAWISFAFVISPALERMETLKRVIPEKEKTLHQLRTRSRQYRALQAGLEGLERATDASDAPFELVTFLESVAADLHLDRNITAMKPDVLEFDSDYREAIVELQLDSITLTQLVDFLLKAKSPNRFLQVKSLYIVRNAAAPDLLDTVIQMSILQRVT